MTEAQIRRRGLTSYPQIIYPAQALTLYDSGRPTWITNRLATFTKLVRLTRWLLHIFYLYFFLVGTAGIILQAPTLYDTRPAIDEELSEIEAINIKPSDYIHNE